MQNQMTFRFGVRRCRRPAARHGMIIVKFAILLPALVGVLGLVVDTGILLSSHRQAQNAADAAALSAAMDMMTSTSEGQAEVNAKQFVEVHNGLADASGPYLNFPPTQGPFAGESGYVEAIVNLPLNTFFIHVLPGVSQNQTVSARAVATWVENKTAGEGVIVLDPDARPGLDVSGGGRLRVTGTVYVNSEGGGEDENGVDVNNGNNGFAAVAGQPNDDYGGIYCSRIFVVGGVKDHVHFKNIFPGDPNPLRAQVNPAPDPLLYLDTPTTSTGVRNVDHGKIAVSNNGSSLDNSPDPSTENQPDPVTGVIHIYPGLYSSIEITGGEVVMHPGIYVIMGGKQTAFKINGGDVTALGVMFYNTGHNYSVETGLPDLNDVSKKPKNIFDDATFGGFTINAGMVFSPIDVEDPSFDYSGAPGIETFDGMLFYQRRANAQGVDIQGGSSEGLMTGTLYAKWANFKISGQGTYDAQFVCGSMSVTGTGDVTLTFGGKKRGKAPAVFLVE